MNSDDSDFTIPLDVLALAITTVAKRAGYRGNHLGDPETPEERAQNLIRKGYIIAGDPYGWASGSVATISMEPRGGKDDCEVPLDYYGKGFEYAARASDLLEAQGIHAYIEFINPGVAAVFPI